MPKNGKNIKDHRGKKEIKNKEREPSENKEVEVREQTGRKRKT